MEKPSKFIPDPNLKLRDQVRQVLRYYHYAYRTEQTYCDGIMRFVKFHGAKIHPKNMGKTHVEAFLSHLATTGKVAAATQRQALNAIVFLYRDVLLKPIEGEIAPVRAKRHPRVPVVMTQAEVKRVLSLMSRTHLLMAKLLYGSGLRLMECVRLQVQDLDFTKNLIYVREAKGGKDRVSLFPKALHTELQNHLEKVKICITRTLPPVTARSTCPMPLPANTPRPAGTLAGNRCFLPRTSPPIRAPAW